MLSKQAKFISAVALQAVIILVIIMFKLSVLSAGTDIALRIQPVDPRDLLRGDYATFQYDISSINTYYLYTTSEINVGDTIYVVLQQNGKYWSVESVYSELPMDDGIFLKGTVSYMDDQTIQVLYGIEEYFIPEGSGQNFSFFDKEASALVTVDSNGNAVIKSLYVDGKKWP